MTGDMSDADGRMRVLAERHGFSSEAARHMLWALEAGGGRMAQFDHPEFGGMGQWFSGGMVMLGRMNDHGLKARVSSLCDDLAAALPDLATRRPSASAVSQASGRASSHASGVWWPDGLGRPSSVGAQNATRYAWFPESRRLAVESEGRVVIYDTGDQIITGVAQQQSGASGFRFTGPHGAISLDDLTPVERSPDAAPAVTDPPPPGRSSGAAPAHPQLDPIAILERLAELHRKGILTDTEFSGKKAELLARL